MRFLISVAILLCCSAVQAQSPDSIAAEMQRHNAEMARLLKVEPFRFTNAEAPAAAVTREAIAIPNMSAGATCNCAVTGECTCDPATCTCAACANGALRIARVVPGSVRIVRSTVTAAPVQPSFSMKSTPSGSFAAVSNFVDSKGRRVIQYSDDRKGRQLKRHTQRGVKLGLE